MANNDYQEYIGQRVYLLVNSRSNSYQGDHSNSDLMLIANLVNEDDQFVDLEKIVTKEIYHPIGGKENLLRGRINKEYIIGVFESEDKE